MATAPASPRSDLDLGKFREMLESERQRVTQQLDKLDAVNENGGPAAGRGELSNYDQHQADQGTEMFFREQDAAVEAQLQEELSQVETALHRIENGTYGYCDRCKEPIPAERLEVFPQALLCIGCASEVEGVR